jgi:RND family efflux transporter MFP subunit
MKRIVLIILQLFLALIILAAGFYGFKILTRNRPTVDRKPQPEYRPLVRTIEATTDKVEVTVIGEGTVRPLREAAITSQVEGRVVYVSPSLIVGGAVGRGEVLVRIDPEDYQLTLILAEAGVKEAETRIQTLQEEAAAALEEWKNLNLGENWDPAEPPPLLTREPQLEEARALQEAAEARVKQARLDLERCEIKSPFEGRVSRKEVEVGQHLGRGKEVATLYGVDAVEITVYLEESDLAWIEIPGFTRGARRGSEARVSARLAGEERSWSGRVVRFGGEVEAETRMVPVVVRIQKPFASLPPLAPGLFVRILIPGRTVGSGTLLPREALRNGKTIWTVDGESRLRILPVEVIRFQGEEIIVDSGLGEELKVIVSPLKLVSDGMAVKVIEETGEERGTRDR